MLTGTADLFATIPALTAWHDAHVGRDPEQVGLRVAKVGQEWGEAMEAWFGVVGNNPRKGVTHTVDDVAGELADVVLGALIAIESLGLDPATVVAACLRKCVDRL